MKQTCKIAALALFACAATTGDAAAQTRYFTLATGTTGGDQIGGVQSKQYQQVSAALEFIRSGRNDAALALLVPLTEASFAPAQTVLGVMYTAGRGVEQDHVRAAQLYAMAANAGDAQAMYLYGHALDAGLGIKRDRDLAQMWMQRASDSGQIEIQKAVRAYRNRI